jgi:hypothetical protein
MIMTITVMIMTLITTYIVDLICECSYERESC